MIDDYVLGRSAEEYERLRVQARLWEPETARLLDRAGLSPGARCLDAGCGPGETMRLMAERALAPADRNHQEEAPMILELPDGATVEILTPLGDGLPCVLRGTIPAGGVVPLHSHADPETFLMIAGEIEGFLGAEWSRYVAGDIHHVPGHARHAWRNVSRGPAEMFLVTAGTMARFFRDVAADPEAFLERYGYWNATPEENAGIGITVPAPARP